MRTPKLLIPIAKLTTAVATLLILTGTLRAQAPPNPTITLNETGQGTIQLPNGAVIPLTGALANDPGPGGRSSALAFTFRPAEGSAFVIGDVLMLGIGGVLSDVIRFNPAALIAGVLTQQVFFYSADTGGGLLADPGLPSAFYPNAVSMNENPFGPTTYMPVAGQPAFNPGSALPTTWRFTSTVPDGGSPVALLALGICGLAVLRRRSGRNVGLLIEKPSA